MSNTLKTVPQSVNTLSESRFKSGLRTHLELGRVSNLPTVWSNVFCGVVVASALGGSAQKIVSPDGSVGLLLLCLMLAMSAFYIAGMYLNDACDAAIDSIDRPARPIPSGRISRAQVFLFTALWFFAGWMLLLVLLLDSATAGKTFSVYALISAAGLNTCIVLYDLYHKNNPISPVIMGMCRVLLVSTCYLSTIAVLSKNYSPANLFTDHAGLWLVCTLILCYLCGLTFIAKFENSNTVYSIWPVFVLLIPVVFGEFKSINSLATLIPTALLLFCVVVAVGSVRGQLSGGIPKAIGLLIAGISLIDAIIMSTFGSYIGMGFGIAAFFLTLLFQRKIAGT